MGCDFLILYNNRSFQDSILRTIKVHIDNIEGKFFVIVSPWLLNFTFLDEVINSDLELANFYEKETTILDIIKMVSKNTLKRKSEVNIIIHDFAVNWIYDKGRFYADLDKIDENNFWKKYKIYKKYFGKETAFNRIWLSNEKNVTKASQGNASKKIYRDSLSDLGEKLGQISQNLKYINMASRLVKEAKCTLFLHTNFHSKIFMTDLSVVAGSSNWTYSGFTKNDELNIYFTKEENPEDYDDLKYRVNEILNESQNVSTEILSTIKKKTLELEELYQDISAEIYRYRRR